MQLDITALTEMRLFFINQQSTLKYSNAPDKI